ncbi:endonuclease III [Flavitalea sp. BT771]|uniref:endonuclease III domain-containing protein n=1 Tax=Flavitalea sp. BT771 TaxID=3063329 RepID=UPI0026E44EE5|nr:endonuclease III [Flavitalea sp. BT771]MDO6431915.1 endonuclease III [Flavitalea sp. BT771]MDV6220824.1 endonuclease III [Flavitalea sp. BT771]
MLVSVNWSLALRPLLRKYHGRRHPLEYHNIYQLVVLVVLSAQSADDHINAFGPGLFKAFPDMSSLAKASREDLFPYISKVRNFGHKAEWLTAIARQVKKNSDIPLTLEGLTALPGIGRKSANVILREAGRPAEGIIVDLHVVRVAQRLGIVDEDDPKKIEKHLMEILPKRQWEAGMAMSFLGREICHPKPDCPKCLMRKVCAYYKHVFNAGH